MPRRSSADESTQLRQRFVGIGRNVLRLRPGDVPFGFYEHQSVAGTVDDSRFGSRCSLQTQCRGDECEISAVDGIGSVPWTAESAGHLGEHPSIVRTVPARSCGTGRALALQIGEEFDPPTVRRFAVGAHHHCRRKMAIHVVIIVHRQRSILRLFRSWFSLFPPIRPGRIGVAGTV